MKTEVMCHILPLPQEGASCRFWLQSLVLGICLVQNDSTIWSQQNSNLFWSLKAWKVCLNWWLWWLLSYKVDWGLWVWCTWPGMSGLNAVSIAVLWSLGCTTHGLHSSLQFSLHYGHPGPGARVWRSPLSDSWDQVAWRQVLRENRMKGDMRREGAVPEITCSACWSSYIERLSKPHRWAHVSITTEVVTGQRLPQTPCPLGLA